MADSKAPHIAVLSSSGVGHLTPLATFATHLVDNHSISVTLIAPQTNHSLEEQALINDLPKHVHFVAIPQSLQSSVPTGTEAEGRIIDSIASNLTFLGNLLASFRPTALIVDLFSVIALDMAKELDLPVYLFCTSSSFALSFGIHLLDMQVDFQGEYGNLHQPIRLPGCAPVHGSDFPDVIQDRRSISHADFIRLMRKSTEVDGILLNSFEELEGGAINCLRERNVCPVGPLVRSESAGSDGGECLKWLDKQPAGSVIYVSFGSGGTLTSQQMEELAWGLEMSGLRFLWVVRNPHPDANAAYFSREATTSNPSDFLPKDFLDRTKWLGLVVPRWAPQQDILGHVSIGGFLTHCGWNSVLESVMKGVPMIAWPLYAEQRLNAVLVTDDLKVALRPKTGEGGIVRREEIARVIKCLMEGEEGRGLRSKIRELSNAAARALHEGGGSLRSMSKLACTWKGRK